MKWKDFLRGLGVGIVLSTLILCISGRGHRSTGDVDIVQKAKELGMVFPEGTRPPELEMTATPQASDDSSKQDEKKATKKPDKTKEPVASGAGVTGVETKKPKTTKKPKATKKPNQSKDNSTQNQSVTFTLRDASTSTAAARELKNAGLIDDVLKFDQYLIKNGFAPKVRAGVYQIPKNASYEQIARILTHQ